MKDLASESILPKMMKQEVELGTRVIASCICCIPTFCLSWVCMHRYVEKRMGRSKFLRMRILFSF